MICNNFSLNTRLKLVSFAVNIVISFVGQDVFFAVEVLSGKILVMGIFLRCAVVCD